MVGYFRSWKKRVAVVGNDIYKIILQSSKLLLLSDINRSIHALYGQLFLFCSKLQRVLYMEVFPFLGIWC